MKAPAHDLLAGQYLRQFGRGAAGQLSWCSEWSRPAQCYFLAYVAFKPGSSRCFDCDDLLLYWAQMVADPALARESATVFGHVLVDEFHTNRLQACCRPSSRRPRPHRGRRRRPSRSAASAAPRCTTTSDFPRQFEPPARCVTLDRTTARCRRSSPAANGVIRPGQGRFCKDFVERAPVGRKTCPGVGARRRRPGRPSSSRCSPAARPGCGSRPGAVLFRASHHSVRLE